MLPKVVNKGNRLAGLLNAVDNQARSAVVAHLPDRDMVEGLPVPIVYFESIPLRRQARLETQLVYFKPQPQK